MPLPTPPTPVLPSVPRTPSIRKQMHIYVGASYPRGADAERLAEVLKTQGFTIVSSWHSPDRWNNKEGYDDPTAHDLASAARRDMDDLDRAQVFVELSGDDLSHGGRYVELGYALGRGLQAVVIGPAEHVFHYLEDAVAVINPPDEASELDVEEACVDRLDRILPSVVR